MSNHPTIAALKARLEVERNDEMTAYELCTGPVGYRNGHEAATERLMAIVEKMLGVIENYEPYCVPMWVDSELPEFKTIKEVWLAREFLLSIRETVADATTLADALGESKNES